jgi:hypothetical protein
MGLPLPEHRRLPVGQVHGVLGGEFEALLQPVAGLSQIRADVGLVGTEQLKSLCPPP